MSNKRVLITGGARGIGAAVAERCRADGYVPVVLDRAGTGVIECDLADPRSTEDALAKALEGGPITRLVNNVGVVVPNPVERQTLAEFDLAVSLNLRTALQCTQAVLPGMREAGFGRIVSVSSRAALGKKLRSAYSATKAGLQGMTRTWALELGQDGITANAVAPGPIVTTLFAEANPEDQSGGTSFAAAVPVGRLGTPDDVAQAVAFLLDARSSFVTGQTLHVCGGLSIGAQLG